MLTSAWNTIRNGIVNHVSGLIGDRGERLAARYLRRQGFFIYARQHRTNIGELDLIAREGETLVFVEVKTRSSTRAGDPVEAVDLQKQRQLTKVALGFLKSHDLLDVPTRFDVVSIVWPEEVSTPTITHFRNAFPAIEI